MATLWMLAVEMLGEDDAEETLQRIMGNRGPGVNPSDTNWGQNQRQQAMLERMATMTPQAQPVIDA